MSEFVWVLVCRNGPTNRHPTPWGPWCLVLACLGGYSALTQYQQPLEIREKIGDIKGKAESLHQIGNLYYLKGEYAAALTQYQQSLEIAEKIGDIAGMAISMGQIGALYLKQNQGETALKLLLPSFAIFTKIGSPNVNIAKDHIAICRKKMKKKQFKAILKELRMLNAEC